MRIIKPKLISGEIMNLVDEADEKMVFVSPYYNVATWTKLKNCIDRLVNKKIHTEFYVREGEQKSISEVRALGFTPVTIKRLHTKLYMNEKKAIISSMNLNVSSDDNSLDIALETENDNEYRQIIDYYERYLKTHQPEKQASSIPDFQNTKKRVNWKADLDDMLEEALKRDVYLRYKDNSIEIQAGNLYETFIAQEQGNTLRISGILSSKEYGYIKTNPGIFQSNKLKIDVIEGRKGHYNMVWGTLINLKSTSIHYVYADEQEIVKQVIYGFIIGVEQLKRMFIPSKA